MTELWKVTARGFDGAIVSVARRVYGKPEAEKLAELLFARPNVNTVDVEREVVLIESPRRKAYR